MAPEKLIEAIETYSNAILGFVVLQSLVFSYTFGTDVHFSCIVKANQSLGAGLILHFVLSTILACGAIAVMSNTLQRIATQHLQILGKIYWSKIIVVLLFAVLPIVLLIVYGLDSNEIDYVKCVARR